jgi:hypothetical protein
MDIKQVNRQINYSIKQHFWFCSYWRATHIVYYKAILELCIVVPLAKDKNRYQVLCQDQHIWLCPMRRSLTYNGVKSSSVCVLLAKLSAFCDLSAEIPRKDFPTQLCYHIAQSQTMKGVDWNVIFLFLNVLGLIQATTWPMPLAPVNPYTKV